MGKNSLEGYVELCGNESYMDKTIKVIVLGDTHGFLDNAIKVLEVNYDVDIIIHLGDYYGDFERIKYLYLNNELKLTKDNVEFFGVIGNTDDRNAGELEEIVIINGHKILLTHGHKYNVKMTDNRIFYRGKELGAKAVIYGHTHICRNDEFDGLMLLNPGSLSIPKGGFEPSYMLLSIEKSSVSAEIKFL